MSTNKIPSSGGSSATATAMEPDYFFLYDKPFAPFGENGPTFQPPYNTLVFCIGPSLLYLLCVYVIFPAMAPQSKAGVLFCSKLRYWHNVILCAYSGFSCYVAVSEMIKANEFHFWSFNIEDMKPMLCNPPSEFFKTVNQTFIWSKIYEMADTAFIVMLKNDHARAILDEANPKKSLSKKVTNNNNSDQVTAARESTRASQSVAPPKNNKQSGELNFLHVYHHCTTFWLFLLVADMNGTLKLGPLMNGFVHFLMYLHYAHPLPKMIVPFITLSQIGQLAFVTWSWWLAANHCDIYKEFPKKHFYEYWTNYLFVPVYLVFFVKFFFERFILGMLFGKKKEKKN